MLYTSPDELPLNYERVPVFVAGGISNCPDWQTELIKLIDTDRFDVINPRRASGLGKTGKAARKQIEWEHRALESAQIVLFWFPKESICPISLFEYGKFLERACKEGIRLIGGCDQAYARAFDLDIQTQLAVEWATDDEVAVDFVESWEDFTELVAEEIGR
jgi:hypothetical protein